MTVINLQHDNVICPYCQSMDAKYKSTAYTPDYILEGWECNHCLSDFGIRIKVEILEIFKA